MSLKQSLQGHRQSGNVLFLILIAVVLFAALSYVVVHSQRGGGSSVSRDKARLIGAQIVQATLLMKTAYSKMVISGVAMDDVRLPASSNCFNECTSGKNCLFSVEGGGVIRPNFPKEAMAQPAAAPGYYPKGEIWRCYVGVNDSFVNSAVGVAGVGENVSGSPPNSTGTDSLVYIGWLTKEVCQGINDGLGIAGIPSQASHTATVYSAAPGQHSACVTFANCADCYIYYDVLYAN